MGSPLKKPSGPFADKLWREALRRAVFKRVEGGKRLDLIAEKVANAAMAGDMIAAKEIGDRLDGKATITADVTVTDERMVIEAPAQAKDADEWAGKYGAH